MRIRKSFLFFFLIITTAGILGGCARQAQIITPTVTTPAFPEFVRLTVKSGDTLPALASKYLKDPTLAWMIADFNETDTISPGQELIIPLTPYAIGGLSLSGYQTVPVLSYHRFSETKRDKMTVTVAAFEEQMKLLKDRGYHVITLDQLFDFLDFKKQLPRRSVVLTIDDGWRSAYDMAFPILKKYGYPATLFVYTDLITGSKKTLSWELLLEMANNGIDIQCHTKTHRNLAILKEKESFKDYYESLDKEIFEAARIIKEKMNKDVNYFAYPYGTTNHLIIALLKKYGFRGAFTVKHGGNPFFVNNYAVNRTMIYGDFDLTQFEKKLDIFSDEALK